MWWVLCSVLEKNLALEESGCWETHKARHGVQKGMAESQLQKLGQAPPLGSLSTGVY